MSAKGKRFLLAGGLAVCMVLLAEALGEKEIIFPEIVALLIGGWINPTQPWTVSKPMLVGLMTGSALAGLAIARYLPGPLYLQLGVAFVFLAAVLILSKTTLAPMISACILPILLHTTSWIYPVSVLGACLAIVAGKALMEKKGLVFKPAATCVNRPVKREIKRWAKLFCLFCLLAAFPAMSGNVYFIAPPLIVAFVEFSNPESALRLLPGRAAALLAFGSAWGALSKFLICDLAGLPMTLSALITAGGLFFCMNRVGLLFPPVGAAAFLPLILPADGLWLYPLEAAVGAGVLILTALLAFPGEGRGRPALAWLRFPERS